MVGYKNWGFLRLLIFAFTFLVIPLIPSKSHGANYATLQDYYASECTGYYYYQSPYAFDGYGGWLQRLTWYSLVITGGQVPRNNVSVKIDMIWTASANAYHPVACLTDDGDNTKAVIYCGVCFGYDNYPGYDLSTLIQDPDYPTDDPRFKLTDGTIIDPLGEIYVNHVGRDISRFSENGELFDVDGNPLADIPGADLPLNNSFCAQLAGGLLVKCTGFGASTGDRYDTSIYFPTTQTPTDGAVAYEESRTNGQEVFDLRDDEQQKLITDNSGADEVVVSEKGADVRNGLDHDLYIPKPNYDNSPFDHSQDKLDEIEALPECAGGCYDAGQFTDPLGGNTKQKAIIEPLTEGLADPQTGDGTGIRVNINGNKVTISYKDTGEVIQEITLSGESLNGADRLAIKSIIDAEGTAGAGEVVTGSGAGTGLQQGTEKTSSDAGLPGGDAPEADPNSTGSTSISIDGFYEPVYPDATFTSLFETHYDTWQSDPMFTTISSFAPTFGSSLPQLCFTTGSFGDVCFDFADYTALLDIMKYIILLSGAYVSLRIIITRGT